MAQDLWTVEEACALPGALIELRTYHWPTPLKRSASRAGYNLSRSLSPMPANTLARFRMAGRPARFSPVGRTCLVVPEIPLEVHSTGGVQTVLQCLVSPDRFETTTQQRWTGGELDLESWLSIDNPVIDHDLLRMARELQAPGFAAFAAIDALLDLIIVGLSRHIRPAATPRTTARRIAPEVLRHLTEYVESADGAPVRVSELATQIGMSPRTGPPTGKLT